MDWSVRNAKKILQNLKKTGCAGEISRSLTNYWGGRGSLSPHIVYPPDYSSFSNIIRDITAHLDAYDDCAGDFFLHLVISSSEAWRWHHGLGHVMLDDLLSIITLAHPGFRGVGHHRLAAAIGLMPKGGMAIVPAPFD